MYTTLRGIPAAPDEPTGSAAARADPHTGPGPSADPHADPSADPSTDPRAGDRTGRSRAGRPRVARIVLTLGTVSFFTDLSSEMVVAVLPVYLTLVLGLTPVQYGVIDALYQGGSAAVRIGGGLVADLTRRPKMVAAVGYGLSCVCKLLFLPAQSFALVTALVAVDRSGKGLRTAPRDAMIADSAEPADLGYAFGVHRAMDTAGALGGPLIAFGVLAWLAGGYQVVFVLSFALAAIGVAVLLLFVPRTRTGPPPVRDDREAVQKRPTTAIVGDLRRNRPYRRLLVIGGVLSMTTISDGFIYLTLRDRVDLAAAMFPLLFVGTAAVYLVLAIPLGRLADRIGRPQVFLAGHATAVAAYLGLWLLPAGPGLVIVVLALHGLYYAATDGVLPALTAPLVPAEVRGTGIAGVQTVMALGAMISATGFGVVWARFGQTVAVIGFACALAVAVVVATIALTAPPRSQR